MRVPIYPILVLCAGLLVYFFQSSVGWMFKCTDLLCLGLKSGLPGILVYLLNNSVERLSYGPGLAINSLTGSFLHFYLRHPTIGLCIYISDELIRGFHHASI